MKRILFVNPSLRLHSETKFLPVGIASVMSYLNSLNVEFDFLDIDINDLDKVNNLSKKLCKNVIALGNCKKDIDGFDSDSFQWTGVHLVPLPNQ